VSLYGLWHEACWVVGVQLHTVFISAWDRGEQSASCCIQEPVVLMEMGALWAPEPIQTLERGEKSVPSKNWTMIPSQQAHSLVTMLTELYQVQFTHYIFDGKFGRCKTLSCENCVFLKIFRRCFSAFVLLFLYTLHLPCHKIFSVLPTLGTSEFHFIAIICCNRTELNSLGNSSVVCGTYHVEDKKHKVISTY